MIKSVKTKSQELGEVGICACCGDKKELVSVSFNGDKEIKIDRFYCQKCYEHITSFKDKLLDYKRILRNLKKVVITYFLIGVIIGLIICFIFFTI